MAIETASNAIVITPEPFIFGIEAEEQPGAPTQFAAQNSGEIFTIIQKSTVVIFGDNQGVRPVNYTPQPDQQRFSFVAIGHLLVADDRRVRDGFLLKRALQREVQNPLAVRILEGELSDGDTVVVDVKDGAIVFEAKR